MNDQHAASLFKVLGHTTRLSIYKLLVDTGRSGLIISAIQSSLDIPMSTLSHHLSELVRAGLVLQCQEGREITCTANYRELLALTEYLTDQCCAGEGDC